MPSFVVFNGITRYVPGGITRINADALNPVTAGENSIVALIGEAEGGEPGVALGFSDPAKVKSFFGSGKLVDAANVAFAPSNDPLIPGGASKVILYKTNASTTASAYLPAMYPTTLKSGTATGGSTTTVVDAAAGALTINDQFVGAWVVLRPGLSTQEVRQVTAYTASTGTFTVSPAFSVTAAASNAYAVLANTADLVATAAAGSDTSTVVLSGITSMTANAFVGQQVYIKGPTSATSYYRTISSNTTSQIVVTPALTFTPSQSTSVVILPQSVRLVSKLYGLEANDIAVDVGSSGTGRIVTVTKGSKTEISPILGGFPFLKVTYTGGTVSSVDTVHGSTASTTTVIQLATGGLTPSAQIGAQVKVGSYYTVVTANTATALTVSPALPAAPAAGTSVTLFSPSAAFGKVTGASGLGTNFVTQTGVPANDLNIVFTPNMTLSQLANAINSNPNYLATVPSGINGDLALASELDFGQATMTDIRVSALLTTTGFNQDVSQVVNYLNSVSVYVNAARSSTAATAGGSISVDTPTAMALNGAVRGTSSNSNFQAGFDSITEVRVTQVCPLIDQDLINEGNSSTATITSVAQQLKDHLILCRGAAGSERSGYIGYQGNKTNVISFLNSMNDMDIAVCAQNVALVDITGTLRVFGPWMQAVLAAGCRAGMSEVGEPFTNKVLKAASVTQDVSWNPGDLSDANDMIQAGLLFAYTDDRNVTRWRRDLTTWIADNNLAYSEGSVRDSVRYVAYGLRKALTDRFVGRKAKPANIQAMRSTAVTFLELMRTGNVIVDSTDTATGAPVRAYSNLKIVTSGDVVTLSVCITPCPGINFILSDISLKLATQVA
jgi:hypothetical protein